MEKLKREFRDFTKDHIDSFNNFLKNGIQEIPKYIRPITVELDETRNVTIEIQSLDISDPVINFKDGDRKSKPFECRRLQKTYCSTVDITLKAKFNGELGNTFKQRIGTIPIMVRSNKCILNNKSSSELVKLNEEPDEVGGYFIINGLQYLLRYLVQSRRNFPIVLMKTGDIKGTDYTGHMAMIRCVRTDEVVAENRLRWKRDTCPDIVIQIDKKIYSIPLTIILMALLPKTPLQIIEDLESSKNDYKCHLISGMFNVQETCLSTQEGCLNWIGGYFRIKYNVPSSISNAEVGKYLLDDYVLIHLDNNADKYNLLIQMCDKLISFYCNECCEENTDTINFQELLTGGSLFQQVFRFVLVSHMNLIPIIMKKQLSKKSINNSQEFLKRTVFANKNLLSSMHTLLSTGTIFNGKIIPGLKQNNALSIILDNINIYRFIANFRSFHRGKFFQDSKDTSVRKMKPECFGFQCPVHTPDGAGCGILNHLTINATVVSCTPNKTEQDNLERILRSISFDNTIPVEVNTIPIMCNGKMFGYTTEDCAINVEAYLRYLKASRKEPIVPEKTEIVLILNSCNAAQFPGLYVFTNTARIMRPVINLKHNLIEYIGTLEQSYLDIMNEFENVEFDLNYTHKEINKESLFSFTASFTPFQNHNPSPRNIYQCQMSKQSMGFTYYQTKYRGDKKLYYLSTPQLPLTRTKVYDEYGMGMRPLGFNAVVAITTYTGYDMEDALVINKSSLERGMGRAHLVKSYSFDYRDKNEEDGDEIISCGKKKVTNLDSDGLPAIGAILKPGSPICCRYNQINGQTKIETYTETQEGVVQSVSLNGSRCFATITVIIQRNTVLGDKFASRHGQKGVNSLQIDESQLPHSSDGMVPDIIFNPHGMPSRMTMAKMIEISAGKLAAIEGRIIDCTAFQPQESISDIFDRLERKKYIKTGEEYMYSPGNCGQLLPNPVNMGIVYYQRLRHMVDDKYQVRGCTGPVDMKTRQPVHGRKVGGGIRLGEMERDGLLSHGAVYTLHERMMESNSDKIDVVYCDGCRTFIGTYFEPVRPEHNNSFIDRNLPSNTERWKCKFCEDEKPYKLYKVQVPAIMRHLQHEMLAMDMIFRMDIESFDSVVSLDNEDAGI